MYALVYLIFRRLKVNIVLVIYLYLLTWHAPCFFVFVSIFMWTKIFFKTKVGYSNFKNIHVCVNVALI